MSKILIIEDDEAIASIERDYLEIDNFEVEIASNGIDGLKRGESGEFDLILLDLMLPGIDGFFHMPSAAQKSRSPYSWSPRAGKI